MIDVFKFICGFLIVFACLLICLNYQVSDTLYLIGFIALVIIGSFIAMAVIFWGCKILGKVFSKTVKFLFSILFFIDFDIVERISQKKATIKDFFLIASDDNYSRVNYKEELMSNIWKTLPNYSVPYNDDSIEYREKVKNIYLSLCGFNKSLTGFINRKMEEFVDKYMQGIKENSPD